MQSGGKRKEAPKDSRQQHPKRKRAGNNGKWKTPNHLSKGVSGVQPGDVGVWVTCARGQETKAMRETARLFEEYAQIMYDVKAKTVGGAVNRPDDIEAAVKAEVDALKASEDRNNCDAPVVPIKASVSCLFFIKMMPPLDPVAMVTRICEDANECTDPTKIKTHFTNRFIPCSVTGKCAEGGLAEVARMALAPHFDLGGKTTSTSKINDQQSDENKSNVKETGLDAADETLGRKGQESSGHNDGTTSFAIRPSIRNNSKFDRNFAIETIAKLINSERHRVNLSDPDKVILVDVFQSICGISVVGRDWSKFKRYNMNEIYNKATGTNEATETP